MRIICFFIGHRWSSWKYVKAIGRYDERLKRKCIRCSHTETYTGPTDYSTAGEKIPYKR
jgi:hypothetical protein